MRYFLLLTIFIYILCPTSEAQGERMGLMNAVQAFLGLKKSPYDYYADKPYKKFKCQGKTAAAVYNALSTGKKARIGHGFYKGNPHRWTEVWDVKSGIWEVKDRAIRNVGNSSYPLEAFKTGDVPDYTLRWYEQTE